MNKEWKCGDCCCFGTDSCTYGVMESYCTACSRIVVDHDKAYEQGRADAIEEYRKAWIQAEVYGCDDCEHLDDNVPCWDCIAEKLKEQK